MGCLPAGPWPAGSFAFAPLELGQLQGARARGGKKGVELGQIAKGANDTDQGCQCADAPVFKVLEGAPRYASPAGDLELRQVEVEAPALYPTADLFQHRVVAHGLEVHGAQVCPVCLAVSIVLAHNCANRLVHMHAMCFLLRIEFSSSARLLPASVGRPRWSRVPCRNSSGTFPGSHQAGRVPSQRSPSLFVLNAGTRLCHHTGP